MIPQTLSARLRMCPIQTEPEVIICDAVLKKCATYITDNAGQDGFFKGEFIIEGGNSEKKDAQVVCFDISLRLFYGSQKQVSGVICYFASAETYDEGGQILENDFTEEELIYYLKG